MHERIMAIGTASYPGYIVRGDAQSMMIDSGVSLLGPRYLAQIKREFANTGTLGLLFLTHSHYDHVGSADYLRRNLPSVKIGAHQRVAELMRKPSVLESLNRLSNEHGEFLRYNTAGEDLTLHPFSIDVLLKQGDEFDLGGLSCTVYETPGHTRDSLTFHVPQLGAVFPGEACGVLRTGKGGRLQPEFIASYEDYMESLTRVKALQPEFVCLAHNWVLAGDEPAGFLEQSLAETAVFRRVIERYLDAANGDTGEAVGEMIRVEYRGDNSKLQPGFLTNLTAQVKHIAQHGDSQRATTDR